MTAPHFSPEAVRFLRALERNNRREWFQPRKEQYERLVRDPMLELIESLNAGLAEFAPHYITEPRNAVFRIYRDTRFSPDKRPYKTNIAAVFAKGGSKSGKAGLYFSFSAKELEIAGGLYHPERETTLAVREHIAQNQARLRRILAARQIGTLFSGVTGAQLSRAPKGFAPDHPAIDLIRMKDWILDATVDSAVACTPDLRATILTHFRAMLAFIEFLNEALPQKRPAVLP